MTQNSPTDLTGEESWFRRDCEERLTIVYDERDDEETPVVCGSCGGTNTGRIVTDGGVDEEPPELGEVMDFPDEPRTDDRRWIVLFEEDYDNVALDTNGNVGVLVDIEQTGELFRLAGQTLASLSHRNAEPDEPIRDLIEALEEVLDDDE